MMDMAKARSTTQTTQQPMPPVDSIPEVYRLIADWRSTLRDFLASSKDILKQHEITSMQYQTLLAIRVSDELDGISMNALAAYLGVRHNSAVGLINRLEARGHVRRMRSERDRRVAHLQLTPSGEAVLLVLAEAHRDQLSRVRPEMRRIFK